MARRKAPRIPDAILDQLLAGADPTTAFEADGLLDELTRCRRRRGGAVRLRGGQVGSALSGHRPELATSLERGRPVLRVPQRGAPDPLHHERH